MPTTPSYTKRGNLKRETSLKNVDTSYRIPTIFQPEEGRIAQLVRARL